MGEALKALTATLATVADGLAVFMIGLAVVLAFARTASAFAARAFRERTLLRIGSTDEEARLRLGRSLALGLEFLLAADIMRTAIAPTWDEIGQLAAIAALRTALNFFLQREIDMARARSPSGCSA